MTVKWQNRVPVLLLLLVLSGCGQNGENNRPREIQKESSGLSQSQEAATQTADTQLTAAFLQQAADRFQALRQSSQDLMNSINALMATPSEVTLQQSRKNWQRTHENYLATHLFRKSGISYPEFDLNSLDPVKHSIEIRIDQFPMIPGYLDAVPGYPASGLIYSELDLDEETLVQQHQFSDKEYVVLGFHALEFMLWGSKEPGWERKSEDFQLTASLNEAKTRVIERRRQYVELITRLLDNDIRRLVAAWTSPSGFYHTYLSRLSAQSAQQLISQALSRENHSLEIQQNTAKSGKPEKNETFSSETDSEVGSPATRKIRRDLLNFLLKLLTGSESTSQTNSSGTQSQESPAQ